MMIWKAHKKIGPCYFVKNLKEQNKVPMSVTRKTLEQIFLENKNVIVPVKTAERMILWTQTQRNALKYNLKLKNHGWIMGFKFYKTVPEVLRNKYL